MVRLSVFVGVLAVAAVAIAATVVVADGSIGSGGKDPLKHTQHTAADASAAQQVLRERKWERHKKLGVRGDKHESSVFLNNECKDLATTEMFQNAYQALKLAQSAYNIEVTSPGTGGKVVVGKDLDFSHDTTMGTHAVWKKRELLSGIHVSGTFKPHKFGKLNAPVFVAEKGDTLFIVPRGTASTADWLTDAAAGFVEFKLGRRAMEHGTYGTARVHAGFFASYNKAEAQVFDHIRKKLEGGHIKNIVCTGHSLGGALAQLFCFGFKEKFPTFDRSHIHVYTAGSPRVGNMAWRMLAQDRARHYRFKHDHDVVAEVPVWGSYKVWRVVTRRQFFWHADLAAIRLHDSDHGFECFHEKAPIGLDSISDHSMDTGYIPRLDYIAFRHTPNTQRTASLEGSSELSEKQLAEGVSEPGVSEPSVEGVGAAAAESLGAGVAGSVATGGNEQTGTTDGPTEQASSTNPTTEQGSLNPSTLPVEHIATENKPENGEAGF